MLNDEHAKAEAEVAVLAAAIKSSWVYKRAADVSEPIDRLEPLSMLAYAMFQALVEGANGTGEEVNWAKFLREALDESIYQLSDCAEKC